MPRSPERAPSAVCNCCGRHMCRPCFLRGIAAEQERCLTIVRETGKRYALDAAQEYNEVPELKRGYEQGEGACMSIEAAILLGSVGA